MPRRPLVSSASEPKNAWQRYLLATIRLNLASVIVLAATAIGVPVYVNSRAFGANDRIVMGCIGMGGQGRGDMGGFMGFGDVRVVAVCHCDHCQRQSGGAFSVNRIASL